METKRKKISAIIACYKDSQAIPVMHSELTKTFKKIKCDYELIFVNDGSPDDTENVLNKICKKDKKTIAIIHSRNFSSQNAFTSGMDIASGDAIVLLDGDLQDPPHIIEDFYKLWIKGNDVVYGSRINREASLIMNIFYKLFYRIFSKTSYIKIPLDAGDFCLMDKKVVKAIKKLKERDRFIRGMRAWVGFKQIGVPYKRPERMFGKTTNNIFSNIRWAKKGIFSYSLLPLELIAYLSYIMFIVAIVTMFWYIASHYIYANAPEGFTTIIVILLLIGSVLMLSLGILAEYLGKILEETKQRPNYIIKKVINYKK